MTKTCVINVELEPIEHRYTKQWANWFRNAFEIAVSEESADDYVLAHCGCSSGTSREQVDPSRFLDPLQTNKVKAEQAISLLHWLTTYQADRYLFFFHDLWHPVITQLLYLRDMQNIDIVIAGCLHAGSYVEADQLAVASAWARHVEAGWLSGVKAIFVATEYHRALVDKAFSYYQPGICEPTVMPFPVHANVVVPTSRVDMVVWPHRLAPEKQPQLFDALAADERLGGIICCKTLSICARRQQYEKLLQSAKVAVSMALEETFGIAMIEATLAGCVPIVPDRLSYVELYPINFRYNSDDVDLPHLVLETVRDYEAITSSEVFMELVDQFRDRYYAPKCCKAIADMVLGL